MTIVDLPEHVADGGEWKQWPRKLDAHLKWGLRQRQISAFIRNGKLTVYRCPDETLRIDSNVMREHFGEPDQFQGRDRDLSAPQRRAKRESSEFELEGDPLVLMFNRQGTMLEQLHAQQILQLKAISEPTAVLLKGYETALQQRDAVIADLRRELEQQQTMRIELEELRADRDRRLLREQAAERRRDETLQLLKDQLPTLAATWLSGDSLSGFGKRAPRSVIDALLDSDALSEQDSEILRRAAGIPRPAPAPPNQANGVSEHGHS